MEQTKNQNYGKENALINRSKRKLRAIKKINNEEKQKKGITV